MKRIIIILMCLFFVLIFTSCKSPHKATFTNISPEIHGFWGGVWHGFTIPINMFTGSVYDYYHSDCYLPGFILGIFLLIITWVVALFIFACIVAAIVGYD